MTQKKLPNAGALVRSNTGMANSDQALIRAVLAGDKEAYGVLVERHGESMFRVAFRITESERDAVGDEAADDLRQTLEAIEDQLQFEMPQGLVDVRWRRRPFPSKKKGSTTVLPLPALLSQLLLAFAIEFEPSSGAPLALCANTIRVLSEEPTPEAELPRLTGCSRETCGLGWQLKAFVAVEPDPAAKRGKVLRLTARGLIAQEQYTRLIAAIEEGWERRFGREHVVRRRNALLKLFDLEANGPHPLLMSEGLVPRRELFAQAIRLRL
jgi:hypothetical protein